MKNQSIERMKSKAHNANLAEMLRKNGEKLQQSGKELLWKSGSPSVTIRGNLWYDHYKQIGGDTISFVMEYYGKSYYDALQFIINEDVQETSEYNQKNKSESKELLIPRPNRNNRKAKQYLINLRKIDKDIVDFFIKNKLIYEAIRRIKGKTYRHVVFVGYDKKGKIRHAHKRAISSYPGFRGNASGSIPEYSFHWKGTDNTIYLFEAPIDMLSYISMHKKDWRKHSYAAACGVSEKVLLQCLKDNPNLDKVYLCLDNDDAGRTAENKISKILDIKKVNYKVLIPDKKDWNEDLICKLREEIACQELDH